jgi:hypothetical protein
LSDSDYRGGQLQGLEKEKEKEKRSLVGARGAVESENAS